MNTREQLMETLHQATNGDRWLTRYALYVLCGETDLGVLSFLVGHVLERAEGREKVPEHLRLLLEERWTPTDAGEQF